MLIFSAPPVPAPVPEDQWEAIDIQWIGWDGSVWNLSTGAEGVVLQASGTEGLHDPQLTKYQSVARAIPGARNRGWRAEKRQVFWPMHIYSDSSAAWAETYRRFFASIHPDKSGTWRVGLAGEYRELQLTGVYDDSYAFGTHPTVLGWGRFGVKLEAVQPYWTADQIERGPWAVASATSFFGSGAPSFTIGASESLGTATMENPGDVDAYPVWTAVGPLSSLTMGVGDAVITVPFSLTSGKVLRVDTDPRNPTATLDGVDTTATLGLQPFAPIQPGDSVPLTVTASGAGSVSVALTPLHFRAL